MKFKAYLNNLDTLCSINVDDFNKEVNVHLKIIDGYNKNSIIEFNEKSDDCEYLKLLIELTNHSFYLFMNSQLHFDYYNKIVLRKKSNFKKFIMMLKYKLLHLIYRKICVKNCRTYNKTFLLYNYK